MFHTICSKSRTQIWDMDNFLVTSFLLYHTYCTTLSHRLFITPIALPYHTGLQLGRKVIARTCRGLGRTWKII